MRFIQCLIIKYGEYIIQTLQIIIIILMTHNYREPFDSWVNDEQLFTYI